MPFLQNRYLKFIGIGIIGCIVLAIASVSLLSLMATSTGLSDSYYQADFGYGESADIGRSHNTVPSEIAYAPSQPTITGDISKLETYETTSYIVSGRVTEFDDFCDTLASLKTANANSFKSLKRQTNKCSAVFYTTEQNATDVLATLQNYSGVEFSRDTSSVSRHKQRIESQTAIYVQQLRSVDATLLSTERQFDEIIAFARENNDAAIFASTVKEKIALIDTLTQRKIRLTQQLEQMYQQSADLAERIGQIEFSVQVHRSQTLNINKTERMWEQAWGDLFDTYTETLIGITATFGIFLLWTVRVSLYLIVAIIALRALWKFGRFFWSKW